MIEKSIVSLKYQIIKLDNQNLDIEGWKCATAIILERIFDENHSSISAIKGIKHNISDTLAIGGNYRNNLDQCINQGKTILEACITEIEIFGLPKKKENYNSGISINLTQNQTVSISILISAVKDELNKSQFDELNEILESNESKSHKRNKIVEKLKNLGSDVVTNIVANLLTNPNIWG